MKRRLDLTLWWLLGAAFCLKLGYLIYGLPDASSSAALSIDALFHYKWASLIASGEIFANTPYFRAPLYPFLLGLLLKVSGYSLMLVRLVQILAGCLTLFFIYRLSLNLFGKIAAIFAFLIYLLYPVTTYFEGELLLDSLFTLLSIASLYFLFRHSESGDRPLLGGLFFGLAALTRPTILAFLPLVAFYLWWKNKGEKTNFRRLRPMFGFFIIVFLVIAPITIINYAQCGRLILISYQGGVNFYIGNNPEADGLTASLPPVGEDWDLKDADYLARVESGKKLLYDRQSSFWYGKGLRFIIAEPVRFIKLTAKKFHFLFSGHEISNNRPLEEAIFGNNYLRYLPVRVGLLIALAIGPLFLATGKYRRKIMMLYGVIIFYGLIVSLFFVTSRFRLPLVPLLAVLGGGTLACGLNLIRKRHFRIRLLWAAVAMVLVFLIGRANPYGVSLDNARQALFLRGNIALRQADYQTATARFDSLTRMSPYFDNAYINLGIAYLKQGMTDSAEFAFQQELMQNARSSEANNNLGVIHLLKGNFDSAHYYCSRALDIEPYYEDAAINFLRSIKGGASLSPEADEDRRRRCRELLAESPTYLFEEALYFAFLQRYPEAIDNHLRLLTILKETQTAVSFTPVYTSRSRLDRSSLMSLANYQLGYLYGLTGDFSTSIGFSRRAIELDAGLKEAYINLISGYRSIGNGRAADSLIGVYLTRWPNGH